MVEKPIPIKIKTIVLKLMSSDHVLEGGGESATSLKSQAEPMASFYDGRVISRGVDKNPIQTAYMPRYWRLLKGGTRAEWNIALPIDGSPTLLDAINVLLQEKCGLKPDAESTDKGHYYYRKISHTASITDEEPTFVSHQFYFNPEDLAGIKSMLDAELSQKRRDRRHR